MRVVDSSREGYNASRIAYVTCAWASVYAHRELDLATDLPADVPEGFEALRQDLLTAGDGLGVDERDKIADEGKMGVYMVYTYELRGNFTPVELLERRKVSCVCDCVYALIYLFRCW